MRVDTIVDPRLASLSRSSTPSPNDSLVEARSIHMAQVCAWAIVQQQAQLHGGGLKLSLAPTGGLAATLTIPATPTAEPDPGAVDRNFDDMPMHRRPELHGPAPSATGRIGVSRKRMIGGTAVAGAR